MSGLTSAGGASATGTAAAHQASCRLPSFRHMSKAQARRALTKAKCSEVVVHFRGKGASVVRQAIRPGMVIGKRTMLILRLGRM
jgi:ribosomal protein S3